MTQQQTRISILTDAVSFAVGKFFSAPLAGLIRAFHVQVGHATVTAAMIIGFSIMIVGGGWTWMVYSLNAPREQARVSEIEASTRNLQLRNAEREVTTPLIPVVPWRMIALSVQVDRAIIQFPAHPLADRLIVSWSKIQSSPTDQQIGGIETVDISLTQDTTAIVEIADVQFGPAWVSGNKITFQAVQILSDNREQRFSGVRPLILVP